MPVAGEVVDRLEGTGGNRFGEGRRSGFGQLDLGFETMKSGCQQFLGSCLSRFVPGVDSLFNVP